jgi:hypothetical protein
VEGAFAISHIAKSEVFAFVSFLFEIAIRETPTQAVINGPGMTLTQRLRLNRNIAYREIGVSDVK